MPNRLARFAPELLGSAVGIAVGVLVLWMMGF